MSSGGGGAGCCEGTGLMEMTMEVVVVGVVTGMVLVVVVAAGVAEIEPTKHNVNQNRNAEGKQGTTRVLGRITGRSLSWSMSRIERKSSRAR